MLNSRSQGELQGKACRITNAEDTFICDTFTSQTQRSITRRIISPDSAASVLFERVVLMFALLLKTTHTHSLFGSSSLYSICAIWVNLTNPVKHMSGSYFILSTEEKKL